MKPRRPIQCGFSVFHKPGRQFPYFFLSSHAGLSFFGLTMPFSVPSLEHSLTDDSYVFSSQSSHQISDFGLFMLCALLTCSISLRNESQPELNTDLWKLKIEVCPADKVQESRVCLMG